MPYWQESLCDNLTVDTCLECLVLADLHNAENLKDASVKYVVENSEEFVDQVKWIEGHNFLYWIKSSRLMLN